MQELEKGATQYGKVTTVGLHVIGFDVSDDGNHRLQMQKRGITFISLCNQYAPRAKLRMTPDTVDQATDDEGGVQSTLTQYRSD